MKTVKYAGVSIVLDEHQKKTAHFSTSNSTDGKVVVILDLPKEDEDVISADTTFVKFAEPKTKVDAMKWFLDIMGDVPVVAEMLKEKLKHASTEEAERIKDAGIEAMQNLQ